MRRSIATLLGATSALWPTIALAQSDPQAPAGSNANDNNVEASTADARERTGSDFDGRPPPAQGTLEQSFHGYYEERRGDYRMRLLPPFYLEHTRGLADPAHPTRAASEDHESLTSLLYYRRRSAAIDADVVFPAFWRVRSGGSHLLAVGPLLHREVYDTPQATTASETDNWLAPLVFQGSRKDGGYFHAPFLLTTSRWSAEKAFTYSLLYFRDRTGSDVDLGVAPFYFHGDNGNLDGAHRSYTLIPPLLYFHRERELEKQSLTVAGPVIVESTAKRDIVDVVPFFFHIQGKPATGGVREEHTTLFPFFHYGYTDTESLFASPLYVRRITPKVDTLLTPLYSRAQTRAGATSLTVAGPIVPIYAHYEDHDLGTEATGIFPFWYSSHGPGGRDWLTPLAGQFERAGVSKTTWVFPTITSTQSTDGWETNVHPVFYFGRSGDATHSVIAPVFWDFASPRGRTTVAFPLFFRVADATDGSITQVAANTVYAQKRVPGGLDWQFHVLPIFSYGEDPTGYFWNVALGLAGYSRHGDRSQVRALWLPFDFGGSAGSERKAAGL